MNISHQHPIAKTCLLAALVALSACGGGSNGGNGTNNGNNGSDKVDYSQLKTSPLAEGALIEATDDQLALHLKNSIRMSLNNNNFNRRVPLAGNPAVDGVVNETAAPPSTPDSKNGDSAGGNGGGFSETNVHVKGVDEADVAKYDGKHWFISSPPDFRRPEGNRQPNIRIVATDPDSPAVEKVGNFQMDEQWGEVASMYLVQEEAGVTSNVATIRNQWGTVSPILIEPFPIARPAVGIAVDSRIAIDFWPGPVNSEVEIQLIDVTDPTKPEADWKMNLDGSLIDSRKIGNKLYLITRYDPWIPNLYLRYDGNDDKDKNEKLVKDIDVKSILPGYRIGEQEEQPLVDTCLIQQNLEKIHGFGSLVTVTTVDLVQRKVLGSTCVNANVHGVYMSHSSLYLGGSDSSNWNGRQGKTAFHKFSLSDEGLTYKASGSVQGLLGWRDPSFFMDEHEGSLRAVTTSRGEKWEPIHHLHVLDENTDKKSLDLIASIPNEARPKDIGKPNEDIYSVRFQGEKAFIVTFMRTDPLYVMDLSVKDDPKIAGELEIPGFATYLHPVNDDVLFSFGQHADERGRTQGVKFELFDVSDIENPKVLGTDIVGEQGSYSEALNNLRALSFLQTSDDQLRVAVPLNVSTFNVQERSQWDHNALYLYEINGLTSETATLDQVGKLVAEQRTVKKPYATGHGRDRGILHGDAVFYAHSDSVVASMWDSSDMPTKPVTLKEPVICTLEIRPSFNIQVTADKTHGINPCDAKVTVTREKEVWQLTGVPAAEVRGLSACNFVGVEEETGIFELEISHPETLPWQHKNLYVSGDECHVHTYNLYHQLKPTKGEVIDRLEPMPLPVEFPDEGGVVGMIDGAGSTSSSGSGSASSASSSDVN